MKLLILYVRLFMKMYLPTIIRKKITLNRNVDISAIKYLLKNRKLKGVWKDEDLFV